MRWGHTAIVDGPTWLLVGQAAHFATEEKYRETHVGQEWFGDETMKTILATFPKAKDPGPSGLVVAARRFQ
jgi:hypothetical protein